MRSVLFFDKMLTPKIITFVYWLLLLLSVVVGFAVMFDDGFTFSSFVLGLLAFVLSAVSSRVWCELLIIFFKMNEALQTLKDK
jgi:hypothetical protein